MVKTRRHDASEWLQRDVMVHPNETIQNTQWSVRLRRTWAFQSHESKTLLKLSESSAQFSYQCQPAISSIQRWAAWNIRKDCPVICRNLNIGTTDPHARMLEHVSAWSVVRIAELAQSFVEVMTDLMIKDWNFNQGDSECVVVALDIARHCWALHLCESWIMPLTQARVRVTFTKLKGLPDCRQKSCVSESPRIVIMF